MNIKAQNHTIDKLYKLYPVTYDKQKTSTECELNEVAMILCSSDLGRYEKK